MCNGTNVCLFFLMFCDFRTVNKYILTLIVDSFIFENKYHAFVCSGSPGSSTNRGSEPSSLKVMCLSLTLGCFVLCGKGCHPIAFQVEKFANNLRGRDEYLFLTVRKNVRMTDCCSVTEIMLTMYTGDIARVFIIY